MTTTNARLGFLGLLGLFSSLPNCWVDTPREVTVHRGLLNDYNSKAESVRRFNNYAESKKYDDSLLLDKDGRPNFVVLEDRPLKDCDPREP